jgi:ribosomal protein L11 methyltransferase
MIDKYINVYVLIPDELHDLALGFLSGYKFTGIVENFDELVITFHEKDWNEETRCIMLDALSKLNPSVCIEREEEIEDRNWNEEWERNVTVIKVSDNVGIAPQWRFDELDTKFKIIINPKMSFGTGDHATTRLVCLELEKYVKPGDVWCDIGTGTGVLAILAVMLGAEKVYAIDNNSWSIDNARENFILNDVSLKIELSARDVQDYDIPEVNGIMANLYSHLILPSFQKFYNALKPKSGILIVSGILKYHGEEIIEAGKKCGFALLDSIIEDEWIAITFKA